jgi:hypothetical protein
LGVPVAQALDQISGGFEAALRPCALLSKNPNNDQRRRIEAKQ